MNCMSRRIETTAWNVVRRIGSLLTAVSLLTTLGFAQQSVRADDEAGFKSLFNGKDLTGWDGNPKFWSVVEGVIQGQTTKENPTSGNTFLIWRDGQVDDFELRSQFKIVGGNSGIQYRSKDMGNWVVGGYQADFDAANGYTGILYEEKATRGIMSARGTKTTYSADGKKEESRFADGNELKEKIKFEDWNEYVVIASGSHMTHKINGAVMSETVDNDPAKQVMSGILALQLHAGPPMTVQFKNIRLKRTKLADNRKKIVLVAGRQSHGAGDHEFNAGSLLLKKCLDKVPGVVTQVYLSGWPSDPTAFDNADTIMFYADGGAGHPAIQGDRLVQVDRLAKAGVGIACVHYGVEVPKERGGNEFLDWIGGYFEMHWSVNPHWTAKFDKFPDHPTMRGVQPFEINDEWYYHMRFRPNLVGVTPILTALPPKETLSRPDGPHSGNPDVRAAVLERGEPQHVAWAAERPDGGRGFGFTGGHRHTNWGNENFRKLVLNALLWTAKVEVPANGVESSVSEEDLKANLDPKGKK